MAIQRGKSFGGSFGGSKDLLGSLQARVNWLYEKVSDDGSEESSLQLVPFGGYSLLNYLGESKPVRAKYEGDSVTYILWGSSFGILDAAGGFTLIASVATTNGPAWITANNHQVVITDRTNAYYYDLNTGAFGTIAITFPNPGVCAFLDSFIFIHQDGTSTFWNTEVADATVIDGLSFQTAEFKPDVLRYMIAERGALTLFGNRSIEFWYTTGEANFPIAPSKPNAIEYGIVAPGSVARCGSGLYSNLCFLARDPLGGIAVCSLTAGQIQEISDPSVVQFLNQQSGIDDAVGMSCNYHGHPLYILTLGFANVTLVYDFHSGTWSFAQDYDGGKLPFGCFINTITNQLLACDISTGNIYTVSKEIFTQRGQPMLSQLTSAHMRNRARRVTVSFVEIIAEPCRTPLQSGTISLRWSKDGGFTWSAWFNKPIAAAGDGKRRARWRRIGSAYDFVFQVKVSGNCPRSLYGAVYNVE